MLDLRGALADAGYAGTDAVADHVLQLVQHGSDTLICVAVAGSAHTLVTLSNVAAVSLVAGVDYTWR
jgi:hypothetical protein